MPHTSGAPTRKSDGKARPERRRGHDVERESYHHLRRDRRHSYPVNVALFAGTADQIAEAAIGAAEAGAAIVHLHARNPKTGKPDHSLAAFAAILPRIKQATDVVVNLTSGGAPYMRIEERIQPAIAFMPELASLNMAR